MRKFLKENWLKIIIAFALVLIGVSVFYYSVIFIPSQEKSRLDLEKIKIDQNLKQEQLRLEKEESLREMSREALIRCFDNAENKAGDTTQKLLDFAKTSEAKEYDLSGAFDSIDEQLVIDKEDCHNLYPQ